MILSKEKQHKYILFKWKHQENEGIKSRAFYFCAPHYLVVLICTHRLNFYPLPCLKLSQMLKLDVAVESRV